MSDFDPSLVRTRPASIPWSIHYRPRCDSTQDLARAALQAGAGPGWTVVADEQAAGRGRHGRAWVAPAGSGLLFSTVLPAGRESGLLPLAVGVAVAQGIETSTGLRPDLKWPNDLLHDGQKLGGILLERPSEAWVIVGIGVNVNAEGRHLPEAATSLREVIGHPLDREPLLGAILDALEQAIARSAAQGTAWIIPAWRRHSHMLGRRVSFLRDGQAGEGVAEDLAADGALLVRLDDGGQLKLVAGDVREVRPKRNGQS